MEKVENQYGLKTKTVDELSKVFEKHNTVIEAIIFGSRAMGNYRESSDTDVALKGTISFDTLISIEAEMDQLMLPYKIDVLLYNKIQNKELIAHIDSYGKVIFSRK